LPGVPAVLKFLKLQKLSWNCPGIWNCPKISVI